MAPAHRFDPNFTDNVVNGMGPKTTPRNREVLGALIRHIHDFAREVELTIDEWMAGVAYVNAVGAIYKESNGTRNETHRLCDILGLESYVLLLQTPLSLSPATTTRSLTLDPIVQPRR